MGRVIEIKRSHACKWPELKSFLTQRPDVVIKGLLVDEDIVALAAVEVGRLYFIYTPTDMRRAGYATTLMKWIKNNMLNEADKLRVTVDKGNVACINMLLSLGYRFIGFTDIDTTSHYLLEYCGSATKTTLPHPELLEGMAGLTDSLYIVEALAIKAIR